VPPTPKRASERRRRNLDSKPTAVKRTGAVEQPPAPGTLHEIARDWYASLALSGQAEFYEPSDWAAALYVAEAMTKNLRARKFSGQLFGVVWGAMNDLLTTEQARRRARVEVERALEETAKRPGVTALDQYRKALA
jgi:hypothetical protein